ncbi:MAG: c-type cytochrome [Candidatus Coatesbacteria bacterium]
MTGRLRMAAAGVFAAAVLLAVAVVAVRRPAATPERRGMLLAQRLGCFNCHGAGGAGGMPNPGAEEGEVPGWTGGALAMYASDDAEVREWIASGRAGAARPLRGVSADAETPRTGLLKMLAFAGFVSPRGIADLAAYVEAVAGWSRPGSKDDPTATVKRGRAVAASSGCFGCHGAGGLTGGPNPGSFTGAIPPWTGGDFRELVRNDEELRGWIRDGSIPRLESNPAARWFLHRQAIRMPLFRTRLAPRDLDALVAYIRSL